MSWLRNLLVFPDNKWREAADTLGGEFVQGKWLAGSEIKVSHRAYPITLAVRRSSDSDSSDLYTEVIPQVSLRPEVELLLYPRMKGLLGSIADGVLMRAGKTIDLPALSDDYLVFGNNTELADRLFGQRTFLLALEAVPAKPTVTVGRCLYEWLGTETDDDEADFCVSVKKSVKNVQQLKSMLDLTKVLLDLLEENNCLASAD